MFVNTKGVIHKVALNSPVETSLTFFAYKLVELTFVKTVYASSINCIKVNDAIKPNTVKILMSKTHNAYIKVPLVKVNHDNKMVANTLIVQSAEVQ